MKIIICGKGGSGKSSVTAVLARALAKEKMAVLVVDADESNSGLHRLLGVDPPMNLLDHLGGKKAFKEKLNSPLPATDSLIGAPSISTDSLPKECVAQNGAVRLVSVGKIHEAGEGCACPIGVLSRTVLSRLETGQNEIVLVDTEAGIEHFGRGLDKGCDIIIGVIDPSFESFELAKKIEQMAKSVDADCFLILNKTDSQSEKIMASNVKKESVVASLPFNENLFMKSLRGETLDTDIPEIAPVCEMIKKRSSRSIQC
ncbi:MAG: hypothetical protein B5M56_05215 [Desulfococcus sp. 4484_241]|nr:MAG: hypothetical protein B5M56_05215 [Desulfococcus sp. 4484_241]